MNARMVSSLAALTLTLFAGTSAQADESEEGLAWQAPGYVQEVVYAAPPRFPVWPTATSPSTTGADAGAESNLARLDPGYVEEVVVVTASRSEALAAAETRRRTLLGWRRHLMGFPAR